MKRHASVWAPILIVIVAFVAAVWYSEYSQQYIHGKYGTHCYKRGEQHGNVKIIVPFTTEQACLDDLASSTQTSS